MSLELDARSIQRQYTRLEDQGGHVLTPEVTLYPSITFDPRDTPQSLLSKAQLLERKAHNTLDELDVLDRQIKRIEDLQRTTRALATGRAQLDRFGDRELPLGRPTENRDPAQTALADTTLNLEELPLDERLRFLRSVREQTQRIYEDLLNRAASFRARISRGEEAP